MAPPAGGATSGRDEGGRKRFSLYAEKKLAYKHVMPSPFPPPAAAAKAIVRGRSFPATREGETDAQRFARDTFAQLGVPPHAMRAALVALDEAASNIVKYAGATRFGLAISASEQGIKLSLSGP